jgi:hypothetical protein
VSTFSFSARHGAFLSIICLALGLQTGAVSADEIDVVGGNSSNSRMFWLNYDAADPFINVAVQLNDDASSYPNLNSFTFFRNTCGNETRSDIIAASTNSSQLVLYKGGKGTGTPICTGSNCPPRPDGLSTSNQQVISVATTGASGTTPTVWLFKPDTCDTNNLQTFERVGGLPLSVPGSARIRAIADTDFVLADTGALEEGDLLVLVSNPPLVALLSKDEVNKGNTSQATVVVDSSHFGRATPTGLAVAPGDGGNLLVTLSTGEVRHVVVKTKTNDKYDVSWNKPLAGSVGMFPNPRGIAAGTRKDETYMVVSDQNQGRYIRAELKVTSTEPFLSMDASARRTIVSPVGAPQGVAINHNDPTVSFATECYKPGTGNLTGCKVGGGLAELHFTQGFDGDLDPDARIRVRLELIPDPRAKDDFGPLKLPGYGEREFLVPGTCRGFVPGPEAGLGVKPHLVLVDIEPVNFSVTPGNFAQVTERVTEVLDIEDGCTETGARIYYHPSKDPDKIDLDGGTLFDITVSCQNPSRGLESPNSPFVFCSDPVYVTRKNEDPTYGREAFVNPSIKRYLDDLKDAVGQLETDFPEERKILNNLLTGFSNPDMSPGKVPQYYIDTSLKADEGARAILELNRPAEESIFRTTDLPQDLYARLLRGFLGLAFYTKETGALLKYYPPAAFCKPYRAENGKLYPELPDVECDCGTDDRNDPNYTADKTGYLCAADPGAPLSPLQ